MNKIEQRLQDLNLYLPSLAKVQANYLPAKRHENLIYVSGQLPIKEGKIILEGQMNKNRDLKEAQDAMACCFLNGLAAAIYTLEKENIKLSLKGVLRLGAFVSSTSDFYEQHLVANGASDLAEKIFGLSGLHARSALGVCSLPKNATVELEILFELA